MQGFGSEVFVEGNMVILPMEITINTDITMCMSVIVNHVVCGAEPIKTLLFSPSTVTTTSGHMMLSISDVF